jgi:hypothetical protein
MKVDITEFILKHVVINSLSDTKVRKDVLRTSDLDQKSLAETVAIIEVGETASRAIVNPSKVGPIGNPRRDSCGQGHRDNKPMVPDDKCLLRTIECESCKKLFKCCKLYQRKDGNPPVLKMFTKCKPCWDRDKPPTGTEKNPDAEMGAMVGGETQKSDFGFMASVELRGTESHAVNSMAVGAGSMAAVFAKLHQSGTSSDPTIIKVPMCRNTLIRAKTDSFRWNQKNWSSPPNMHQMATVRNGRRSHKAIRVPNMLFSNVNGWGKGNPEEHPTITVTVSTENSEYDHLSLPMPQISPKTVRAVTDSRCQSSLMGLETYYSLGLKKSDLVRCESGLSAINGEKIEILGAIFLRLSGKDCNMGKMAVTVVQVYVTPATKIFYLS